MLATDEQLAKANLIKSIDSYSAVIQTPKTSSDGCFK